MEPDRSHSATPIAPDHDRGTATADERALLEALDELRHAATALEARFEPDIEACAPHARGSARNLVHYLAMRRFDLHGLQGELARLGLSSLGRAEAHVLATIDAVRTRLDPSTTSRAAPPTGCAPDMSDAIARLAGHADEVFGPASNGDRSRIMVTLPSHAATDGVLAADLLDAGADLVRINGAHDDVGAWRAMAGRVRAAAADAGVPVRVAFDLPGPKLRTGPLPTGPGLVRVQPRRTADGHVQRLARVRFRSGGGSAAPAPAEAVVVPVDHSLVAGAAIGDELILDDHRGRRRRFLVTATHEGAIDTTSDRTSYLATGTSVRRRRDGVRLADGRIGALPAVEPFLRVRRGDLLRIEIGDGDGRAAVLDPTGLVVRPITISCPVPELVDAVRPGDRLLVDDGRIETTVEAVEAVEAVAAEVTADAGASVLVRVERPDEAKLRAGKGINLPDGALSIPAVTEDDRRTLAEIAPFVDVVAVSFATGPTDLDAVWDELDRAGRPDVAVVLKIEHAAAFRALPRLLLHGLRRPPIAVMVARGDLAVEVGFERLAEVQEEILWLCEAAHVPVIWATQVLESLAKEGVPTRAEVTDAAWAGRAECVMLNKGPHVVEAVRFLGDVLVRMQAHQRKRTALLRPLAVSALFDPPDGSVVTSPG